jgi:VanZ family protein
MLPDLLVQSLLQVKTNPWYHVFAFTLFGLVLTLCIKEVIRTVIIFIIVSIFAEVLQLYYPRVFMFEWVDIVWNFLGCGFGMSLAFLILVSNGGHAFPKGESQYGDNS